MGNSSRSERWIFAFERALEAGPKIVQGSDEINKALDHILQLLRDATLLFRNGSWPTASFLAITALEETAKTHVAMHRKSSSEHSKKRSKDPLYRHKDKHLLGASPTISMGDRLSNAIGSDRLKELIELAASGHLVSLRESCLYLERTNETLLTPNDVVSKEYSRELLLFSLEALDDALVGYTNHSLTVGERADELFIEIVNCYRGVTEASRSN